MLLLPAAIIQNGPTFKSALVHTMHDSFGEVGFHHDHSGHETQDIEAMARLLTPSRNRYCTCPAQPYSNQQNTELPSSHWTRLEHFRSPTRFARTAREDCTPF